MMRYGFFAIVFALLQLFSVGAAYGLRWWLQPWTSSELQTAVMILVFMISNGLLLLTTNKRFTDSYRWVSGWLLVMHFMLITALLTGIAYGIYLLSVMFFDHMLSAPEMGRFGTRVFALLTFVGLTVYALYSAYVPIVRPLAIEIDKPWQGELRIAMASDLHLGKLFGNRAIDRLRHLVVKHRADILLMPGDIMDDNTQAFTAHHMMENLTALIVSLPHGVYATLGNHDLYGHEISITDTLRRAGVHLLNDEVLRLSFQGQTLWLVGRFDNHKAQRVATAELLAKVNTAEPVILLDHRPSDIDNHSQMPIDLQVSGHTHNGQIYPANFIVKSLNRIGYGHGMINHSHFVVSSGYGFWGIPFRLGSRSEMWLITLTGK